MKLIDKNVSISTISFDPNNPRYPNRILKTEEEIIDSSLNKRESKELLRSMQSCIRWVNKIVVITISDYKELFPSCSFSFENSEYVVIEGNTRLACLKSNKIETINPDSMIPVLIASREPQESLDSFKDSLLITQGIANVMVVKEWEPHAKAKHIFEMYLVKKTEYDTVSNCKNLISSELGISRAEVDTALKRYSIFKKVSDTVETISDTNWGYLEAFDTNSETRTFIGLNDNLEWNEDIADSRLELIPDLINSAKELGISTKSFRNIFRDYIKSSNNDKLDEEDMVNELKEVSDNTYDKNLSNLIKKDDLIDNEIIWDEKLTKISNDLQNFPAMSDWAVNKTLQINKIKETLDKIIQSLKS